MILLDRREPPELERHIQQAGPEVSREMELDYGDCAFSGNGPEGPGSCMVGFERKKLSDLITSMQDRRLAGRQLSGMCRAYDFVYLVAEGIWREGSGGEIEERGWDQRAKRNDWRPVYSRLGSRAVSYEQLDHFLCTWEVKRGVKLKRTKDPEETARFYVSRWRWFNGKGWDEHTSDSQVYCGPVGKKGHGAQWAEVHGHDPTVNPGGRVGTTNGTVGCQFDERGNPTTLLRMAMQLPGVMDKRAALVAGHFGTVEAMARASEEEWLGIEGIGPKTSAAVVRAIRERGA